jgi:ABC-type branched-subunit amino acid transport system permease subunit
MTEAIAAPRPARARFARPVLVLAGMALLALVPWWASPYVILSLTAALALGLFALSYDLVLGVTGLISVSHATLFGVGAYGMAISMTRLGTSFWPSALIGIAAAMALAWVIGFFSVRTSGPGFIIMTVIFAHAVESIAYVWTGFTGGENGIALSVSRVSIVPGLDIRFAAGSPSAYYAVIACLGIALWACRRLIASPFGLVLRGIKGNEPRALALGYRVGRYKVLVNVIAGAVAAVGGILYALLQGFVSVDLLRVLLSIEVIVWTILGGPGTLLGPVLAAVFMSLGIEYLRSVTHQYVFAVGLITLAVVLFLPQGLGGLIDRLLGVHAKEAAS